MKQSAERYRPPAGIADRREAKLPRRLMLRSLPVVPRSAVLEEGVDGGGALVEHATDRL